MDQVDINLVIIDSGGTWRTYLHRSHDVTGTSAVEIGYFKACGLEERWGQGTLGNNEGRAVAIASQGRG